MSKIEIFVQCGGCEEVLTLDKPIVEGDICPSCKEPDDFFDLVECEDCGEHVLESEIIDGWPPDNSGGCDRCWPKEYCGYCQGRVYTKFKGFYVHQKCWEEGKADYDHQCAKDARSEAR